MSDPPHDKSNHPTDDGSIRDDYINDRSTKNLSVNDRSIRDGYANDSTDDRFADDGSDTAPNLPVRVVKNSGNSTFSEFTNVLPAINGSGPPKIDGITVATRPAGLASADHRPIGLASTSTPNPPVSIVNIPGDQNATFNNKPSGIDESAPSSKTVAIMTGPTPPIETNDVVGNTPLERQILDTILKHAQELGHANVIKVAYKAEGLAANRITVEKYFSYLDWGSVDQESRRAFEQDIQSILSASGESQERQPRVNNGSNKPFLDSDSSGGSNRRKNGGNNESDTSSLGSGSARGANRRKNGGNRESDTSSLGSDITGGSNRRKK